MFDARTLARRLKLEIFERGVGISPGVKDRLTRRGSRELVERDYVTTAGLTLVLDQDIYVNAPVGEWFCDKPAATLDLAPGDEGFVLKFTGGSLAARVLPLPSYLNQPDGNKPHGVMTHADRVRLSPIDGCACACRFCDWPLLEYRRLAREELLDGLRIALDDPALPPRHVLVSGGTPRAKDEDWLENLYLNVIETTALPVDVMLMPWRDVGVIERLVDAGVHGFSINIEIFDRDIARRLCPSKHQVGLDAYARTIRRAVELTGGAGRVRSLLLVGLEPARSTLDAVDFIAALGADPVLSPFRPAEGTELARVRPSSASLMEDVHAEAHSIAQRHAVRLGPRCIPCMHNTVTFPDGDGARGDS